jgi:DNA-binding NarL/FixJ family response regulator
MIRVLAVDDHPLVRAGLRAMLASAAGIEVVAEASSAAAARAHEPDVVLMDLRMPGGDGAHATALVLAERPGCRVVILTTFDNEADIVRAVEAGATGYVPDSRRDHRHRARHPPATRFLSTRAPSRAAGGKGRGPRRGPG